MSNQFNTVEELYAVVIGVLFKDEGKVSTAKFNKIIKEYGLDRINIQELKDIVQEVRDTDYLNDIKDKALEGTITLGDLQAVDGEKPFNGNDYWKTVSTYVVENERHLSHLRELRKHNREGAYLNILMDDLKKELKKDLNGKPLIQQTQLQEIKDSEKHLVVCLSDWHIGFTNNDYHNGGYNYDTLVDRLEQFIAETIETIKERNINDVTVFFIGDLVEHVNMRDVNQAFDTEFTLAEQISKGTRLLADVLDTLREYTPGSLTFGMIGGNHDRMQGNKNQKIYNDNVAYIVLDTLLMLKEQDVLKGINIIDNLHDIYTIRHTVANKNILVNHGDGLKGKGNHINKFIETEPIDLLLTGHVHHFSVKQEDFNRMHIVASSPMGYNNYAKELHLSKTMPSQQLIVLDNKVKDVEIKTVFLD